MHLTDVLRVRATYSESEKRAKYGSSGKLASRHSAEDFTKRRAIRWGDFPMLLFW